MTQLDSGRASVRRRGAGGSQIQPSKEFVLGSATHVRALDGMRFFAFFAVFLFHALQNSTSHSVQRVVGYGGLGVQVFFVLSGFLIGGGLLELRRARQVSIGSRLSTFYARRALRIFPVYYLSLAMLVVLQWSGQDQVGGRSQLVWNMTYMTNVKFFIDGHLSGGLAHLWSLSVEEHFYLVAPLLILCASTRVVSWVCVAGFAAAAVGRVAFELGGHSIGTILSPMQFDCMMVGIAAAILQAEGHFLGIDRRLADRLCKAAGVVVVPLLLVQQLSGTGARVVSQAFDNFVLSVAVAGLILALWNSRAPRIARLLTTRPLPYLGKISYALYLFHLPLLVFASSWFAFLPVGTAIPALVMTIGLAALSWRFFEGPINSLKRNFPLTRGETVAITTSVSPSPA